MKGMKLHWEKAAAAALTAVIILQSSFFIHREPVQAQEGTAAEAQVQAQEVTATEAPAQVQEEGGTGTSALASQDVQTEEGSAVYARLRIGDWLDYGDYGIERTDIPGTDYFFYITTLDADGAVINDDQLAYCVQSYFLTPLPGDHSDDMTDQVSSIGGEKNLQKIIYYGYGGAGYDADEFVTFLANADTDYYETVYVNLSESEQAELCYILTHAAASYAYFMDGMSLEEYMRIQFRIKYGENWEGELSRFEEQELEKAEIQDGDMDLFGAAYGMNPVGIALTKGWYQLLTDKKEPGLGITVDGGIFTFYGNERNSELKLSFTVPEDFSCTIFRSEQETEIAVEGEEVIVRPAERFLFTYTGENISSEKNGISDSSISVEGILSGTENEVWNLVLLQTDKGTDTTVSKRQQDIAAASMLDAGKTKLDFDIELQKGSVSIRLTDDDELAVQGAGFGIYYDAGCSNSLQQDGEAVEMTTDYLGEAYLEFVMNQELEENDGKLYVKMLTAPAGYLVDEEAQCIAVNGNAEFTAAKEMTSVNGTVSWRAPEGTALPDEISVALKRNDEVIDTKAVTEEDDWSYSWDSLPKYSTEDAGAAEYDYSVEVAPVEGFDTVINGYDAVNTIIGEVSVEGQGVWHDGDDADGLRPERITVGLYRDDELLDSGQISDENDWRYSFKGLDQYSEDGSEEYVYTVDAEAPEGYTFKVDEDQIILIHTASTALNIEGIVDLTGRNLEEGEFSFDLVQVTDETGESEVENGIYETAVNDKEGKIVFPDIIITEPGTYYFRITEAAKQAADEALPDDESETDQKNAGENAANRAEAGAASAQLGTEEASGISEYIVRAEVSAAGEDKDQLEAAITYLNGQPEFKYADSSSEAPEDETGTETEIAAETEDGIEAGNEKAAAEAEAQTESSEKERAGGGLVIWVIVLLIIGAVIVLRSVKRRK